MCERFECCANSLGICFQYESARMFRNIFKTLEWDAELARMFGRVQKNIFLKVMQQTAFPVVLPPKMISKKHFYAPIFTKKM